MTFDDKINYYASLSAQRLNGLEPIFRGKIERILAAMEMFGFPIFIVEGVRTDARQHELYEQGRTKPGPIVTFVDAIRPDGTKGLHQIQADGYGHAIDFAFVDDPRTPKDETWDDAQPWDLAGLMAKKMGLVWGGDWPRLRDSGHIELPVKTTINV